MDRTGYESVGQAVPVRGGEAAVAGVAPGRTVLAERHAGEAGGGGAAAANPGGGPGADSPELESSGAPLDAGVRAKLEKRFGASLSHVRVHTDAAASKVVAEKGARAFSYKNHIAFAAGAYDPASPEGEALLVHELTHVLQANATSDKAKVPGASAAGGAHEQEADRNAHKSATAATAKAPDGAATGGGGEGAAGEPSFEANQSADPERRHQCGGCGGGAPAPAAMTMSAVGITVTQAATALSQRGSASYKVQWSVGGGKNGWVIQHVRFRPAVTDEHGVAVAANNSALEYWEGWQVRNGNVFVGSSASAHVADTFQTTNENAKTKGQIDIIGKVAFCEGYDLQEPPWGHAIAAARSLPTLASAPDGWNDGSAQSHTLRVNYDDAAGTPQTQVGNPA